MRSPMRYAALTAAILLPIGDAAAQADCAALYQAAANAASAARIYGEAADQAVAYAHRVRDPHASAEARRSHARAESEARKAQAAQARFETACGVRSAPQRAQRPRTETELDVDTASAFVPAPRDPEGEVAAAAIGTLLLGTAIGAAGVGAGRRRGPLPVHRRPPGMGGGMGQHPAR